MTPNQLAVTVVAIALGYIGRAFLKDYWSHKVAWIGHTALYHHRIGYTISDPKTAAIIAVYSNRFEVASLEAVYPDKIVTALGTSTAIDVIKKVAATKIKVYE